MNTMKRMLPSIFFLVVFGSAANAFQAIPQTNRFLTKQSSSQLHPLCSTTAKAGGNEQETTVPQESALSKTRTPRVSVLLCPAQFCVPADYEELFVNLRKARAETQQDLPEIGTCRVAPLPRTEWIKVAQQLPTRNFVQATLSAKTTLRWYFDAMENALAEIFAEEGHDTRLCLVGHSIGGWVARAYIGGLSG